MDHQEQKAEQKRHERKEHHRHALAAEHDHELRQAEGPRRITPVWFAVIGLLLALVALLRWMAIL